MTQSPSAPADRPASPAWRPFVSTVLLLVPSWLLVGSAAGDEPFCCWTAGDAFVFVGLGSGAFVLWSLHLWQIAKAFRAGRQRLALGLLGAFSLFALLHVAHVPIGYLSDLSQSICSDAGQCRGFRGGQGRNYR